MNKSKYVVAVGALAAVIAAGIVLAGRPQQECFSYESATHEQVCGTPTQLEIEMRWRGHEMAVSVTGTVTDAVSLCVRRAVVQADMQGWPDRYRDAYADGCRSATVK